MCFPRYSDKNSEALVGKNLSKAGEKGPCSLIRSLHLTHSASTGTATLKGLCRWKRTSTHMKNHGDGPPSVCPKSACLKKEHTTEKDYDRSTMIRHLSSWIWDTTTKQPTVRSDDLLYNKGVKYYFKAIQMHLPCKSINNVK